MDDKTARDVWAKLTDADRRLVLDAMAAHPRLSLAAAIAALREAAVL